MSESKQVTISVNVVVDPFTQECPATISEAIHVALGYLPFVQQVHTKWGENNEDLTAKPIQEKEG